MNNRRHPAHTLAWLLSAFALCVFAILQANGRPRLASQSRDQSDQAVKQYLSDKYFLDEAHPGPTLVPRNLPSGILPFSCRPTQAFEHRASPGAYHFEKAVYLLGQGLDFHGCEIFGLDRIEKLSPVAIATHALKESLAAVEDPYGLEQWTPSAGINILTEASHRLENTCKGAERTDACRKLLQIAKAVEGQLNSPAGRQTAIGNSSQQARCAAAVMLQIASAGDTQKISECVANGSSVDMRGVGGRTPLMQAALSGQPAAVKLLLQSGATPDAMDNDRSTPLRDAVVTGNLEIVNLLLETGKVDVNQRDDEGATALHDAAALEWDLVVQRLLESGADAGAVDEDSETPLLAAVDQFVFPAFLPRQVNTVQLLLQHGANPGAKKWDGAPVLNLAAAGEGRLVGLLLDAGANANAKDSDGSSPLHVAAEKVRYECARILLTHGADPNARDNKSHATPLMNAAREGLGESPKIVHLLLERGADPNATDKDGSSALVYGAGFVRSGSGPDWAAAALEIMGDLIRHGADVNDAGNQYSRALIDAADNWGPDDPIVVKFLIDAGATIRPNPKDGVSALMRAASKGHSRVVQFLLDIGADPLAKDTRHHSAMDYARDYNSRRTIGCIGVAGLASCQQTRAVLKAALDKQKPSR